MSTEDFLRPTRAEADRDAAEDRADRAHRIRCLHQGGFHDHASAAEVRACRAGEDAHDEEEALAELAWEANGERAYAEALEARSERGTWFGPTTEADSWGEDQDPAPAVEDPNACRGGRCTTIDNLCSRHQGEYQARYGRASNE